jgi:hypothetical protein
MDNVDADDAAEAILAAFQQFHFLIIAAVAHIAVKTARTIASSISSPGFIAFVDGRRGRKLFKVRNKFNEETGGRKNYKGNHMWRMIENRWHHNVRTIDGRDFRKNYRVPATFFDDIVRWFRESQWFCRETDGFLRPAVPLELKILAVFTMLGRGVCAAVPAKEIGCDEKTIQEFFKFFCMQVAKHLYQRFICFPSTVSDVSKCVQTYARENLPGCMGSIDCVHIPWIKCLASVRSWFVGKEGVPTVAFQVIVDHSTRILSISQPHPGASNDKTIASMDPWLQKIRTLACFVSFSWTALTRAGSATFRGVYLICDGGYHQWRVMQRCSIITSNEKFIRLNARIASARKDVECTFGRVKNRFRILKIPSLLQNLGDVANVFITCCIFHNMYASILLYDMLLILFHTGSCNTTLKEPQRSTTMFVVSCFCGVNRNT